MPGPCLDETWLSRALQGLVDAYLKLQPCVPISRHRGKLRPARVISAHREGRRQLYTVDDPHVITLIQQVFAHIAPDGTHAPDPAR